MTKLYSIKDVAAHFNLSISTIRFYDKKGLLPFVSKNETGYRVFTESDMNFIYTICCLRNTGMPLKKIKLYIDLCMVGPSSINQRKELLNAHKKQVVMQQTRLQENLKEINKKINRYDSKEAVTIINAHIQYVVQEKAAHHLANPFDQPPSKS